jgi:DNA-binding transcriptional LysR family regulator
MEPSNNLQALWPYLPAFRAVAEAESLSAAAAQLHVVPSALSRSVRMLEAAVGQPLFTRTGGRLVLNPHGRAVLEAARQAMHGVERAAAQAAGRSFAGEYRVATLGVLTHHVVLPVLLELAAAQPAVVPVIKNYRAAESNHRLALGELDIAFYYDAVPFRSVTCRRLGMLTNSVYCGRGHPLFTARRVDRARLLAHAFSVPSIGDRNTSMDGWPVHVERKIGFRIELLITNLAVCRSGRFLTVLPDVVAEPFLRAGELRRFAVDLVSPVEVYGACREGEEQALLNDRLLASVERRVADIARAVGKLSDGESSRMSVKSRAHRSPAY